MDVQAIKLRFGIIGNSPHLDRAIDVARQVAPTDISVLITGESGVGKESFPQIIHHLSPRKHGPYIAVNCGAIPEGTIDSELFGHEKGSFTGAHEARKGYFEVVNGGTIFLDEIADLPLSTQVRLLRVLETGEFLKVGSSKVIKTDVRVVAATNLDMLQAIGQGKFRQDLFYRLNTVPIQVPALRERKEDIHLLFRKFAADFAEKYRMPPIMLEEDAVRILSNFRWPGNIRQLKNLTEQISIIEKERSIDADTLKKYIPAGQSSELPVLFRPQNQQEASSGFWERDILYKYVFDTRRDMTEMRKEFSSLRQLLSDLLHDGSLSPEIVKNHSSVINRIQDEPTLDMQPEVPSSLLYDYTPNDSEHFSETEVIEENYSLEKQEMDMIRKALEKHDGKRKNAAKELGISERTLYRKIKEYEIE
ncbi:MAG: sigma-54 dependent transcriptional regulator [Bacteroidales bacterium]|nr:sigma-54 dependent transcriptional regulator [Bacteroidales bacterium]